jgi:hypothetical protein
MELNIRILVSLAAQRLLLGWSQMTTIAPRPLLLMDHLALFIYRLHQQLPLICLYLEAMLPRDGWTQYHGHFCQLVDRRLQIPELTILRVLAGIATEHQLIGY